MTTPANVENTPNTTEQELGSGARRLAPPSAAARPSGTTYPFPEGRALYNHFPAEPTVSIERMFESMAGHGWRSDEHRQQLRHPPEPVWLDLAMAYPVPDDAPVVTPQDGRDVQSEVRAEVTMQDVTTTGHTLLYVRYDAPIPGPAYTRTAQWVLAWTVRPRDDGQPLLDVHTSSPALADKDEPHRTR